MSTVRRIWRRLRLAALIAPTLAAAGGPSLRGFDAVRECRRRTPFTVIVVALDAGPAIGAKTHSASGPALRPAPRGRRTV